MTSHDPFHEGEVAVQERAGERAVAVRRSAMIGHTLERAARSFLAAQRTIAVAAVDDLGRPWASLWLGSPGFISCPSEVAMRVARPSVCDDPVGTLVTEGREVGTLAIDFATRGRLRVNGRVAATRDSFFELTVREWFPNCKKHIRQRVESREADSDLVPDSPVVRGGRLDAGRRAVLASVDTVFVASRHHERGVDVSHRGGAPGFVRVLDDRSLRFPDYPGNSMFQTLGNFEVDPRGGVLSVDFARGRLLSMTGKVRVTYGSDDPEQPSGGTGRYWELAVDEWVDFPMPAGHEFRMIESPPYNPAPVPTVS